MTPVTARIAVFLLVALAAMPARGQEARTDSAAILIDELRAFVRKEFYDRNALTGFEDVLNRQSGATLSKEQLSGAVEQALRALKASHTGRYTPDQIEYYELMHIFQGNIHQRSMRAIFPPHGIAAYAGIGIVPRRIEGRTFAIHVYHGTPADRAGLKAGDEILSVDGKPFEPIGSFKDRIDGKASVRLRRRADGEELAIDVPVVRIQPGDMFRDAIRSSVRVIERDNRRIGYVRIWTYAARGVHSLMTELLSSEPLKSTDGLVLDLRSRWGGAPANAAELFVGRTPDMTLTGPDGKQTVASTRWHKPVVALIDQGSRSGIEIFAYALKKAGIKLIGTRTAGAVLAGRGFLLNDDSLLVLAVADVRVDGVRLEGDGVAPDIEIAHDIRYSNGADPPLERALGELGRARVN